MDLNLKKKVAIVTGASAGLGKSIALSLSTEGVSVAISGRNLDVLNKTAVNIESATKIRVMPISADMSQTDSVKDMVRKVVANFGTVHILINNVGQGVRGLFTTVETHKWQAGLDVNLMSAIYASSAVVPYMQKQKWGRIVNIAALSATEPNSDLIASNVAKSGLLSFSKTLSRELASDNILVNCVSPGLIDSPQNNRYFTDSEPLLYRF